MYHVSPAGKTSQPPCAIPIAPPPRPIPTSAAGSGASLLAAPPRASSLIITVWGDAIAPHGGAVMLAGLIELLAPFGINERLVRTSVFRLAREGWLAAKPVGRREPVSAHAQRRAPVRARVSEDLRASPSSAGTNPGRSSSPTDRLQASAGAFSRSSDGKASARSRRASTRVLRTRRPRSRASPRRSTSPTRSSSRAPSTTRRSAGRRSPPPYRDRGTSAASPPTIGAFSRASAA